MLTMISNSLDILNIILSQSELLQKHRPLALLLVVHVSEVSVLPYSKRLALLEAMALEESVS